MKLVKKLRNTTHKTGEYCHCKRYQRFKNVLKNERDILIRDFNILSNRDSQNANINNFSYIYKMRVTQEHCLDEISVCFKGFLSLFGVTVHCLQTIKTALVI